MIKNKIYIIAIVIIFITLNVYGQGQTDSLIKKANSKPVSEISDFSPFRANPKLPVTYKNLTKPYIQLKNYGQEPSNILNETPSMTVYNEAGNSLGHSYFRLRGIDLSRVNVTLDGVPLNELENQQSSFSNFPDILESVNSIQIQRGIGLSKNGVASLAGSINLESINLCDSVSKEAFLGFGSYNSRRFFGKYNSGLENRKAFYVTVSNFYSDGFKEHSSNTSKSILLSTGYFDDDNIFTLLGFIGNQSNQLASHGVPLDSIAKNVRFNANSVESDSYTQVHIQLRHTHIYDSNKVLNSYIFYNFLNGNFDSDENYISGEPMVGDILNNKRKSNLFGFYTNYNINSKYFDVSVGFHANSYSREHKASTNSIGDLYSNMGHKNGFNTFFKTTAKLLTTNLFLDLQYRIVNFSYEGNAKIPTMSWAFPNVNCGINQELTDKLKLYYSFGRILREPARKDMFFGNDNLVLDNDGKALYNKLASEVVIDNELGIKFLDKKTALNLNYYYLILQNEAVLNGQVTPSGFPLHSNNATSYRTGFELDLTHRFNRHFSMENNSCISTNVVKERNIEVQPVFSPRVILNQDFTYRRNSMMLGITARYQSASFIDYANSFILPSFFTLGVKFSYSIKWIEYSLFLNNITDERYYTGGQLSSSGQPLYFVQSQFNFFTGIRCTF